MCSPGDSENPPHLNHNIACMFAVEVQLKIYLTSPYFVPEGISPSCRTVCGGSSAKSAMLIGIQEWKHKYLLTGTNSDFSCCFSSSNCKMYTFKGFQITKNVEIFLLVLFQLEMNVPPHGCDQLKGESGIDWQAVEFRWALRFGGDSFCVVGITLPEEMQTLVRGCENTPAFTCRTFPS